MEGWERIQYVMDQEGLNKNAFSVAVGISNNVTITRLINEKRSPSRATCKKISDRFPQYSFDWLLSGTGEIKKEVTNSCQSRVPERNAKVADVIGFMQVPLINVHARCGYLSGFGDPEYLETLPTLPVIVDKTYHGQYRLFEAEGDSMDDGSRLSVCDGDIVLGREVRRNLWSSRLHINDWYFIIIHRTEGISIKKIAEHNVEQGIIVCHSLNDMFNDYEVYLDEVSELYNLIRIVDRNARL